MLRLIIAIAALALAVGLAQADEPKLTDPTSIVEAVTIEGLATIIREIGGQEVQIHDTNGTKSITFVDAGIPYGITLSFCEKARPEVCYAFAQLVLLEDNPSYTQNVLNKWNKETSLLTLFKDDDDKALGIGRIELTDGGVTKAHIASAITWYVIEVRETVKALESLVVAGVQPDATAKPLALGAAERARPITATPQTLARLTKRLMRPYEKKRHLAQ